MRCACTPPHKKGEDAGTTPTDGLLQPNDGSCPYAQARLRHTTAGMTRVSDNRYARVPAGAAERDRLTWDSYYPAAPFFGLFSQFHDYNRNVISLRHHSANGKVSLLRSNELIYPKLSGPFVEFHKAIFWVGGWDPYSLPRFSNRSSKTIICSFSRGSTERCPAVQSGAAELAACARAFGMRLCRAKQEIPPFSRS